MDSTKYSHCWHFLSVKSKDEKRKGEMRKQKAESRKQKGEKLKS